MLATKMLSRTGIEPKKMKPVVSFLCSDSGSHDYTIHRREAIELGLQVEKPDNAFYNDIKSLYDDFAAELKLTERWNPVSEIGSSNELNYRNKRCIIETATGGSHYFLTEGKFMRNQNHMQVNLPPGMMPQGMPAQMQPGLVPGMIQFQDQRIFEGWKYEKPPTAHQD
jgi:hypothetical protein